jgi:hypothetical protein
VAAPVYRFLPWARTGLAQEITNPDNATGSVPARTSIQVNVDATGGTAPMRVDVYGPSEVTGIDRRLILRTEPRPGATDFEPNYLAAIEFDPPDFPWLFTPAAHRGGQLRPWCVLVVVEKGAGVTVSVRADAPLPVLTIAEPARPSRELPDLTESWAWAHTQILEAAGSGGAGLETDPDGNLSRLVCPRRLKPETRYLAGVVPAFDLGVARGLGQPVTADQTQAKPAWKLTDSSLDVNGISLPLYYFWEFSTAVEDDIESMARRLHGPERAPKDLGRRRIFAAAGHKELAQPALPPAARTITMEGALRPAGANGTPLPGQAPQLRTRLVGIVARRKSRELPAPLYGEWPAEQHTLEDAPAWFSELNTTVAHRIAAALGTEVVRRNQEAFVQAAWEQVGQVREANDLAQRARLAAAVLGRMVVRHFAPRQAARLVQLAGPVLPATSVTPAADGTPLRTIAAHLADASVPTGAASPAYRRLASGQRQAVKLAVRKAGMSRRDGVLALTAGDPALVEPEPGPPDGVTALRDLSKLRPTGSSERVKLAPLGLEGETTVVEVAKLVPLEGPVGALPTGNRQFFPASELGAVVSQATERAARTQRDIPPIFRAPRPVTDTTARAVFNAALTAAARATNRETAVAAFVGADVAALGGRLLTRLDARVNVARRIAAMVTGHGVTDGDGAFDPYEGIAAFPIIADSTYQYLDALPGGWVLPEANGLEPDTAILLRTNPEFTSAFLVGVNDEMNSELLWRGYPTDQRGTPFQHFWDRVDEQPDIELIHRWRRLRPLATAGAPGGVEGTREQIVLLLRGTLLRRYPDLVIYATKGTRAAPGADIPDEGRPMFFGQVRPDISLVGFPMTPAQLAAAQWWFVLEQQLTAPRFGFDSGPPDTPQSWSDASWQMFGIEPGEHIRLTDGQNPTPVAQTRIPAGGRLFGSTADEIAISLLQRPIRVSLHKDRLLLHPGGGS